MYITRTVTPFCLTMTLFVILELKCQLVQKHGLRVYPTGKRVQMANGTDANCQGLVELLFKIGQNMCQLNFLVVGGVKLGFWA